jgi:hypothetical protein
MRFEFYHEALAPQPKLSVDGIVGNAVHFSHWRGNTTEPAVRADTSTEIALNVAASRNREDYTHGIDLVINNHFDTDGLLSVWSMLNGDDALDCRDELIAAAEAGDFSELPNAEAVRASIVIQGSEFSLPEEGLCAPLAREMNDGRPVSESTAYHLILPEVRDIIENTSRYERLWIDDWIRIEESLESFAAGRSTVTENPATGLSLITLDPQIYTGKGFTPTRHIAPYTAIAENAGGRFFLIAVPQADGWWYRLDYPYYSWAQTVVRPEVHRLDLMNLVSNLNPAEEARNEPAGTWCVDDSELASAIKFIDGEKRPVVSHLDPEQVASLINAELTAVLAAEL